MNPTFFTRFLLPAVVLTAVFIVFIIYDSFFNIKPTKQCAIDGEVRCTLQSSDVELSVQFLQNIELEEELSLIITAPESVEIQKMWVQGVNMYMGKSAVLIDKNTQLGNGQVEYQARLFLGACSEPQMKWQLIIQTQQSFKQTESWFYNFSTDRGL